MGKIHFESALLIAIVPAVITSLIDGIGELSNSKNFREDKALEAIKSFRTHIEVKMNNPNTDYYKNIFDLSDLEWQQMIMFLNQWSVYVVSDIASNKIIVQALRYELQLCLITLKPVSQELKYRRDIKGYLQLEKYFISKYK